MKNSTNRSENERIWKSIVERSNDRTGNIEEFCAAEGVSSSALSYWQNKLRSMKPSARRLVKSSPFDRVEILDSPLIAGAAPPNAKWVAELILHLHSGTTL